MSVNFMFGNRRLHVCSWNRIGEQVDGYFVSTAATAQGAWILDHAWEHGWIVRHVAGATGVTGYSPEPWHLRYIGPELSRAYHDGGWTSLEEFFGLDPAPGYVG